MTVWNALTGKQTVQTEAHVGRVNSISFSPDDRQVVTTGLDKRIKLWDMTNQETAREFQCHETVNEAQFHPQKSIIVSAGNDRTLKIWDTKDGIELQNLKAHGAEITSLQISRNGQLMASGDKSGVIKLWFWSEADREFKRPIDLIGHSREIKGLSFGSNDGRLASIGLDGMVVVWDTNTAQEAIRLRPLGQSYHVFDVKFTPDGKQLLASRGNRVTVWNTTSDNDRKLTGSLPKDLSSRN